MPFLRPGHPILTAVAAPAKTLKRGQTRRAFGLLTLCSLGAPSMAHGKPFRAVGVKAWTSGSETFIRARPSADVPPVAKVARHTPLYVWGKYNGWYRVETHDHIFGWVYNKYIEAPKNYKVRAMPESKARLASDRTADQTMYGSPQLLKKHYAAFGAPGALKGLQKHGIRLAAAPQTPSQPQRPVGNKTLLAKAVKPAPKAAVLVPKPRVRLAGAPREVTTPKTSAALAPRLISPVPSAERIERRVPLAPASQTPAPKAAPTKPEIKIAAKPVAKPEVRIARVAQAAENRAIAPALTRKSEFSAPRVELLQAAPNPATPAREATLVRRDVGSDKIAESARGLTPSAKFFARAASSEALRPETPIPNPISSRTTNAGPSREPLTNSNFEPLPFQAPVAVAPVPAAPASMAPVAPRIKISTPAPRRIAKRIAKKPTKKVATRRSSRTRYSSRRERQREQLRAKMGLSTSAPRSVIAPVSPAELMRARNEYLAERKARLGLPSVPETEVPVVGLAPLPIPGGPLGGPAPADAPTPLSPAAPTGFAPMSFEPSHPLAPLLGDPYILSLAQMRPENASELAAVGALKPLPVAIPARGGSPRNRTTPLRGGSPRDRFGSGMATQALSYRGMPYIRGAASPSRGFDCSGLVYYLLRQRGFNPPRTAAGYGHWGQSVPKGQLKSGDLVLFANTYKRGISHIGVYLGDGKFVHAATSSTGVRVSSLNEAYYRGKYFGARRAK